jgi:hypothetical protein
VQQSTRLAALALTTHSERSLQIGRDEQHSRHNAQSGREEERRERRERVGGVRVVCERRWKVAERKQV